MSESTKDNPWIVLSITAYNAFVVAATVASVYYISGWMFFLLLAIMNYKHGDKE